MQEKLALHLDSGTTWLLPAPHGRQCVGHSASTLCHAKRLKIFKSVKSIATGQHYVSKAREPEPHLLLSQRSSFELQKARFLPSLHLCMIREFVAYAWSSYDLLELRNLPQQAHICNVKVNCRAKQGPSV